VGLAFLFLPFLNPFNRLIHWILPNPHAKVSRSPVLEKNLLLTPALALSAAKLEILKMGRDAQSMVQKSLESVFTGEPSVDKEALTEIERSLDERYEAVRQFLSMLMEQRLPEREANEVLLALRTLHDIEQIADIVEDRVIPRVEILRDEGIMLSQVGREELREYHTKVLKQISRSLELFNSLDESKASRISERFERYCVLAYDLKDQHFRRLKNHVLESEQTTNVHLNLVSALFDIANLATNIARHMKERSHKQGVSAKNESSEKALNPANIA
jgi:phosphate:Na+ symporter